MKKKINMKALAAELNLSTATISKALKNSHDISSETKKRVIALAKQLNYTPNPYASSLRKKTSHTIAVVLPEVADNFFSLAINGIESVAEKKGYHVLIYLSHEKFEIEKAIIDDCSSGRVDGVLLSITRETTSSNHIQKLQAANIPIVLFDRALENFKAAKVVTNDYESGYLATKKLIENGCKDPVFLSISASLSLSNQRAEGFKKALQEAGIHNRKENAIIHFSDFSNEQIFSQITNLITSKKRPDGIVASVERLATILYLICLERNIQIPDEIKVIAFSCTENAPIFNPSLSTITQPAFQIGKASAEILFKSIAKENYNINNEHIIIPSKFNERKSSLNKEKKNH